jgi:ribosomal protein S18 acetylase RimI-like enzyme
MKNNSEIDIPIIDFSSVDMAKAIEANGVACCTSWANWPDMELHKDKTRVWTITKYKFPFFNNIFNAHIDASEIHDGISGALSPFNKHNVPMLWWTGPSTQPPNLGEHLLSYGFEHVFEAPEMAIDLNTLKEAPQIQPGLTIKEVLDRKALKTWCEIMTFVYDFPDFALEPWFDMLASLGLGPGNSYRHYLAWFEEKPVATASVFFGAGLAGLSSVATLPEYRQQGLGTAITLEPLLEARRMGYRIGALFSSEMAVDMYKEIGFKEYARGNCYIWTGDKE